MFIECESENDIYKNLKRDLQNLKDDLDVDITIDKQEVMQL